MQLTYRGQAYTTSNTTETVNTQATFTYRGQTYQRFPSACSVISPAKLMYRGIPYLSSDNLIAANLTPSFS